jgi:hypothetical protein
MSCGPQALSSCTLAKGACLCTASGRITFPPEACSRDLHQPSVKIDDTPEPEAPSAQSEAPSARPEAPSAPEGETLRVKEERSGVTPNRSWQTPYLQYLHRGELPLDRARARWLARCAKSFVLLGMGRSSTTAPQALVEDTRGLRAPLGKTACHRQSSEARDKRASRQSRRGLHQNFERLTATSPLPLRCFQVVHSPCPHASFSHQGRVSLASAKPDPPSGAKKGGTLLCVKIFSRKGFLRSPGYVGSGTPRGEHGCT